MRAQLRIGILATSAFFVPPVFAQSKPPLKDLTLTAKEHAAERRLIESMYPDMMLSGVNTAAPTEVFVALLDLNNDGLKDIVAQFAGSLTCGSAGCSTVVLLARKDGGWDEVLNNVNTHAIRVGPQAAGEFRPLWLSGRRGFSRWDFRNGRYECCGAKDVRK